MTPPPSTITERGTWSSVQRVLGGEHPLAVDLEAGQRPGVGAGGEDDGAPTYRAPSTSTVRSADEPALALDDGDAAALDQPGEALEEAGDDAVLVLVDAGHVDALEGGVDPELLGVAGGVGDLGGVQQRLGGDAADVQAGAAELALLDQGRRTGRAARRAGRRRSRRCRPRGSPRRSLAVGADVRHPCPPVCSFGRRGIALPGPGAIFAPMSVLSTPGPCAPCAPPGRHHTRVP